MSVRAERMEMTDDENTIEYVTVMIGGQLFGLPISRVQDVFIPERITPVPLAPAEVAGVLNLRGRVVTAIDARMRLGVAPEEGAGTRMAVGVEYRGESYGLLIDAVGEVMRLPVDELDATPGNLDRKWARVSGGVYQLEDRLLVVLDMDRVLEAEAEAAVAA